MVVGFGNGELPILYCWIYAIGVVSNERMYIVRWYCSEKEHHENYVCAYFSKVCSQVEKVHFLRAITVPKVKENLKIILIVVSVRTDSGPQR